MLSQGLLELRQWQGRLLRIGQSRACLGMGSMQWGQGEAHRSQPKVVRRRTFCGSILPMFKQYLQHPLSKSGAWTGKQVKTIRKRGSVEVQKQLEGQLCLEWDGGKREGGRGCRG